LFDEIRGQCGVMPLDSLDDRLVLFNGAATGKRAKLRDL
jgi:hypothetical protein